MSISDGIETQPKTWRAGTLVYTGAGLVILFCWLLWGDFAWSMKERAAGPVFTVLVKKFQASDLLLASLTVSLPAAINIVLAPVVSYRSDRHRGRWGRRIPYLIITTPIAALAMVGLAFSPKLGERSAPVISPQTVSSCCSAVCSGRSLNWRRFQRTLSLAG